jgi:hypothetical protein
MSKHESSDPKSDLKSTSIAPARASRRTLFGQAPLLEGEDAAAYDQLLARVCAAVKPVDIIDELFIADVVSLEWEVLRWRRLKSSLIRARALKALEDFLADQLDSDYELYSAYFADYLAEILQDNLPENQTEDARTLAHKCADNEPDAVDKVTKVLDRIQLQMGNVLYDARINKTKELVQEYVRREPNAVTLVDELLTSAGMSMDTLTVDALGDKFDYIERIDRLTTIAESRRNASLHEIARHRAVLGHALRSSVQEIEDGEFEEIDTSPPEGKNAA